MPNLEDDCIVDSGIIKAKRKCFIKRFLQEMKTSFKKKFEFRYRVYIIDYFQRQDGDFFTWDWQDFKKRKEAIEQFYDIKSWIEFLIKHNLWFDGHRYLFTFDLDFKKNIFHIRSRAIVDNDKIIEIDR